MIPFIFQKPALEIFSFLKVSGIKSDSWTLTRVHILITKNLHFCDHFSAASSAAAFDESNSKKLSLTLKSNLSQKLF